MISVAASRSVTYATPTSGVVRRTGVLVWLVTGGAREGRYRDPADDQRARDEEQEPNEHHGSATRTDGEPGPAMEGDCGRLRRQDSQGEASSRRCMASTSSAMAAAGNRPFSSRSI